MPLFFPFILLSQTLQRDETSKTALSITDENHLKAFHGKKRGENC
jgi:hypothetical protein